MSIYAKLAAATPQPVLRLHPNLPALYKNKVRQLAAAINEPGTAAQAGEIMRGLIDRIVLTPGNGSLKAELYGNLARLMAFAEPDRHKTKSAGSAAEPALLSVVAGARNCLDLLLSASIDVSLILRTAESV
jgi:site-specific DNA recombinase